MISTLCGAAKHHIGETHYDESHCDEEGDFDRSSKGE